MKRLRLPLLALGCAFVIQGVLIGEGIVINHTPSLPMGFYRKTVRSAGKGSFVLFRPPLGALTARPYAHEALLKEVVAVAGDRVSIEAAGVSVNGRRLSNSARVTVDRDGLPLPQPVLTDYTLRDGELLTMSTYNPRSFDSRYFGPVSQGQVVAVVEPILTW